MYIQYIQLNKLSHCCQPRKDAVALSYLPICIDDSGEEFHADMNHDRYLVNRIHDTTVLGRYQASHLATGIPITPPQVQVQLTAFNSTISLLNDHDLCTGHSSRYQYLLSIAELNDVIIGRINNIGIASQVYYFKTKKSGNQYIHISEVTYIHNVFPGSISQEENWTDSVHNHDNEYVLV